MIRIEVADWQARRAQIRPVREAVFIAEQHVPVALEWDELDSVCTHLIAMANDRPIGTARMTATGKIGRMAVLKDFRRQRVGSELLSAMLAIARQATLEHVALDAQVHAIPFYENFGFAVVSEEFMDAGIAHRKMRLRLR